MERETVRRRFLSGVATAGAAVLGGCGALSQEVQTETSRRVSADGVEALTADNRVGDLSVRAESREDVLVRETKIGPDTADLSAFTTQVDRSDGTLTVRGESTGDTSSLGPGGSMDLTVVVPESTPVTAVATDFGDATVTGTAGDLDAESGAGTTEVVDTDGDVTVESGSGNVIVDGTNGVAAVDTNSGDVEITGAETTGDVSAVAGTVTAEVNGVDGDTTIKTVSGGLTVRLAPNANLELDAETREGSLTVDTSLDEQRVSDTAVSGTLGDGGPTLSLRTESGNLTVESL